MCNDTRKVYDIAQSYGVRGIIYYLSNIPIHDRKISSVQKYVSFWIYTERGLDQWTSDLLVKSSATCKKD